MIATNPEPWATLSLVIVTEDALATVAVYVAVAAGVLAWPTVRVYIPGISELPEGVDRVT